MHWDFTEGGEDLAGGGAGQALGAQQMVGQGTRQHGEHILAEVGQAGKQAVLQQGVTTVRFSGGETETYEKRQTVCPHPSKGARGQPENPLTN